MAEPVSVVSASVVSGELLLGLSSGQVIRAGFVQGQQGPAGIPGPKGDTGPAGRDGNGLLHGPGAPTPGDGREGDFYIDTSRAWLYGPRVGTNWGSPVKLRPDPAVMALPTGFKAEQGDPIYPRAFAGAMAGGGGSVADPAAGTTPGGLSSFTLGAALDTDLASAGDGDLLGFQATTGMWRPVTRAELAAAVAAILGIQPHGGGTATHGTGTGGTGTHPAPPPPVPQGGGGGRPPGDDPAGGDAPQADAPQADAPQADDPAPQGQACLPAAADDQQAQAAAPQGDDQQPPAGGAGSSGPQVKRRRKL